MKSTDLVGLTSFFEKNRKSAQIEAEPFTSKFSLTNYQTRVEKISSLLNQGKNLSFFPISRKSPRSLPRNSSRNAPPYCVMGQKRLRGRLILARVIIQPSDPWLSRRCLKMVTLHMTHDITQPCDTVSEVIVCTSVNPHIYFRYFQKESLSFFSSVFVLSVFKITMQFYFSE